MNRFAPLLVAVAIGLSGPAMAQDDGSFLERSLEDALSGEGRDVAISGFQGALSSEAQIAEITFSDADGVWLRIADVTLSWTRSALLRGRVDVERLTAEEIELVRPPAPANEAPAAEASGFSLPDLPVSIEIGTLAANRLILGEALFGQAAELSLDATLSLADGEGSGQIKADRLDGKDGAFLIEGAFNNADRVLMLSAMLAEDEGGIIATLAGLPGTPSVDLTLSGNGPLTDFVADLTLATDGADRLQGALNVSEAPETPGTTLFDADLGGDIAPLLFPEYQAFFGPDLALAANGARSADGALSVDALTLTAAQIQLNGQAVIGADGLPDLIDLSGRIAAPDGSPVLLPAGGAETRIDGADLLVLFDADRGEDWTGRITVQGLAQDGLSAETIILDGRGLIADADGLAVSADFDFDARNLDLGNPDAEAALGEAVEGRVVLNWQSGAPLEMTDLTISGETYSLSGNAKAETLDAGVDVVATARLEARDLSAFSGLAGRPLSGAIAADLGLNAEPVAGIFDVTLEGLGTNLTTGIAEVDQLLAGDALLDLAVRRDETGSHLDRLSAKTDAATITGSASVSSTGVAAGADVTLIQTNIIAKDLPGPLTVTIKADGAPDNPTVVLTAKGPTLGAEADLAIDLREDVPSVSGSARLNADDLSPFAARLGRPLGGAVALRVDGRAVTDLTGFDVTATAETRDLKTGEPDADAYLAGAATLQVKARRAGETTVVETFVLDAPLVSADATATLTPAGSAIAVDGQATLSVADLSPLAARAGLDLSGAATLRAKGQAVSDFSAFDLRADADTRDLRIGQPDADAILAGSGQLLLEASRADGETTLQTARVQTPALTAEAAGTLGADRNAATFDARLADVARWVPGFSGAATVQGTAEQAGGGDWQVDVDATAPGGIRANAAGGIAPDFNRFAIGLNGAAPLPIANRFITPNALAGTTTFDLRLDGAPALNNLSGRITSQGARLSAPEAGVTLTGIDTTVALSASRATLQTTANVRGGGTVSVSGPIALTAPYAADLAIQLRDVALSDPTLYKTLVRGDVSFSGPATGGARIGGALTLEDTEVRIPDSTSGGLTTIPEITHRNEPSDVRQTRARAGLLQSDTANSGSSGGGAAYPLDLSVTAPNRIFLRGRGLEAELGGGILLRGSTANVIPSGQFDLIRGRLDILGQRISFTEGIVTLQGDFDPFVRLVAETQAEDTLVRIIVEGLASAPEVRFTSEPELPEDEVLARLLFGRGIDTLSPLQAAQLASAVATLAGKGGDGLVARLRQNFGLDDLDVTSDGAGGTQVRAGKYISDNAYTDITVDSEGGAEASINLDISPSVTVRGKVGSTGNTGLGIFFERDY